MEITKYKIEQLYFDCLIEETISTGSFYVDEEKIEKRFEEKLKDYDSRIINK
jgi:hypothetical protein